MYQKNKKKYSKKTKSKYIHRDCRDILREKNDESLASTSRKYKDCYDAA
ncbi:MAG: hypothetical protein SPL02_01145 [Bacilli bacterium]|nr:hypothetical protein [Bacilli bacterium]MDY6430915.1 hypothetical protein [Bacilli bacterium]